MKRILALLLIVFSAHFSAHAQGASRQVELAIGEGAWYYNHDDFAAAQKHLERAVTLDHRHPKARIYLARVIHRQYKPDAETAAPSGFRVSSRTTSRSADAGRHHNQ